MSAIVSVVHRANEKYIKWSDGDCIHDIGIESLVSSSVAESLFELGKKKGEEIYLTLESIYGSIIEKSEIKRKGKPPALLSKGQRADIVYWGRRREAIGVIEIKRHFQYSLIYSDIKRTASLLKKYGVAEGGHMRWGAVSSMTQWWETTRDDCEAIKTNFINKAEEDFPELSFKGGYSEEYYRGRGIYEGNFFGYRAFAVIFKLKK